MFKTSLVAAISMLASTAVLAQTGSDAMRSLSGRDATRGQAVIESRSVGIGKSDVTKSRSTKPERSKPELLNSGVNKSCAQFGPGFVRAEGSDTCVRIGGSIGVGVGSGFGYSGGMR